LDPWPLDTFSTGITAVDHPGSMAGQTLRNALACDDLFDYSRVSRRVHRDSSRGDALGGHADTAVVQGDVEHCGMGAVCRRAIARSAPAAATRANRGRIVPTAMTLAVTWTLALPLRWESRPGSAAGGTRSGRRRRSRVGVMSPVEVRL